ncbi:hypothetical protein G6L37_35145 [Agrobacterium rubi]|nr:hypothetical protein [Agrobacterium rubi]NTF23807.1 hypothetical protein [Agrobacterium rubi]
MSNVNRIFKIAGDIGHEVVVNSRETPRKGLPNGEVVTIEDFLSLYEGRTVGIGVPPGLWRNHSWAMVRDARGVLHEISIHDLEPMPGAGQALVPRVLLEPLPDTPFWEDDLVETYQGRVGQVSTIDYENIARGDRDWAAYRVRYENGIEERLHARSLTLVERGNVWRFYNDESPVFETVLEEIKFYNRISHVTEVANVAEGMAMFHWDDALQLLKSGEIDVIWHDWDVASSDPGYRVSCYVIDEIEARDRCRQALIEEIDAVSMPSY